MGYMSLMRMAGGGILKSVLTKALILGTVVLVAQGAVGSYLDQQAMLVATTQELSWQRQASAEKDRLSRQADEDRERIGAESKEVTDELERERYALYKREVAAAADELPDCPASCKAPTYLVGES